MGGTNPLRVGIIPVGAIFYLQDDGWWRERHRSKPMCREPWIVEGFQTASWASPGATAKPGTGSVYLSGRSNVALVRSLRNGRLARVAVQTLIVHEEEGLRRDETTYPTRPDLTLYRLGRSRALESRLAA